jgi:hypothetical protein
MTEVAGGEREHPRQTVERAAAAAIEGAENFLLNRGAQLDKLVVLVWASGVPDGEQDASVAGCGFEDGADLLSDMLGHVQSLAKQLGVEMQVIPHEQPPGQG